MQYKNKNDCFNYVVFCLLHSGCLLTCSCNKSSEKKIRKLATMGLKSLRFW